MEISKNEFILASVFALMGFVLTGKSFLDWLNTLSPIAGLAVYYGIILTSLLILTHFGLVIGNIKFTSIMQALGILLIIFSFEVVTDWESCYVPKSVGDTCTNSNIFIQSEDGATYFLVSKVTDNLDAQRILTYVAVPFLLTLLGSLLVSRKLRLGDLA